MITKFKLFESNYNDIPTDLIEYLDENIITSWYDENYYTDIEEVAYLCSDCVWNNFDKERFVEDFIDDMKVDRTYDDFDSDDLMEYIKTHLTDDKENKIIELYNENNFDEDDTDSDKVTEFDIDYLEDLDKDQLIDVIEEDSDEYDFVEYTTEQMYNGYTAEDIFSEFIGVTKDSIEKENQYSYNKPKYTSYGEFLYKEYQQYVNDAGVVKEWRDNEDLDYKIEQAKEQIYDTPKFQRNILKNNKDLVLKLAELFEDEHGRNIGDEYDFQKAYVEKYVEENADMDDDENVLEETAIALEYLNDNYQLDGELEEEYRNKNSDYLYKVDSKKYNL